MSVFALLINLIEYYKLLYVFYTITVKIINKSVNLCFK